jgi:hypothetical protein
MFQYRKWYLEANRQLNLARQELQDFKAEVYEKETIQQLARDKQELEKQLAVSEATRYAYGNCAETLTKALNNITEK